MFLDVATSSYAANTINILSLWSVRTLSFDSFVSFSVDESPRDVSALRVGADDHFEFSPNFFFGLGDSGWGLGGLGGSSGCQVPTPRTRRRKKFSRVTY